MEATVLEHAGSAPLRGPSPLLRLAGDERLVALTRRGNQTAFETLVARYQARLLAFCRHMVGTREDAEDVLQEVFAAAYNAMIADDRPINVRPWLYRIARNRSLNHLRKTTAIGVDSMDVHVADHGTTTDEKAHKRAEFRQLMEDVGTLPESQRTALILREIDAMSYEQIAEAMDTTIPSIKSLLVRARVSLAEAAEARALRCEDVREQLGQIAEGVLARLSPPARRHIRSCDGCSGFRRQLRTTGKRLNELAPAKPVAAVATKAAATLAVLALVATSALAIERNHAPSAAPSAIVRASAPAVVGQASQPAGTIDQQPVGGASAPSETALVKATAGEVSAYAPGVEVAGDTTRLPTV